MLAGRVAATAPYSWSGSESTLHEHLDITFERLKGAGGLKSLELDALASYVSSLAAPPAQVDGTSAKVMRGREIFASTEAACATCHTGADGTDNKHHDVGSKTAPDRSAEFNTPSLRFVGGTGPYFHDGRYKTLKALLKESDGKMGKTSHLSADDLDALESYLRSL
jgi:mono/diheme cytochrome c family protein